MAKVLKFWNQLSTRERIFITTAVIIGLIFLFVNYIFDPIYASYQNFQSDLQTQKSILKRYQHLVSSEDKAREKLRKIKAIEQGIDQVLLQSSTSDLANAELQGIIKTLAQKADITFTRITPNKAVEADGFYEVSLKLPFDGTIQQLQTLLYEIDAAPQVFQIKSMSIRTQQHKKEENNLRIEMVVAAYIRSGEQSEGEESEQNQPEVN